MANTQYTYAAGGNFAQTGSYSNRPAERPCDMVTRADSYSGMTTGRTEANASVFGAYAEGPSARAGSESTRVAGTLIAGEASAEASLFKAGVKAGPVVAELNPNLNTGVSVGATHVSANLLGFGLSLGSKTFVSTPLGKIGFSF